MSLYINGQKGCKVYYEGVEMCVGYLNGQKVFGCRNSVTVDSNSAVFSSKSYTFKEADFTKNFVTDAPNTYNKVYIIETPEVPELKLLGSTITEGSSFSTTNSSGLKFNLPDNYAVYSNTVYKFTKNLDTIVSEYNTLGYNLTDNTSGILTFTNKNDETDVVTVKGEIVDNSKLCFSFQTSDNSEEQLLSNIANFCLIPQGDINVKPLYVNLPPTIGDNSIKVKYNEVKTFTKADFTDNTHPSYSDPEGDAPWRLLVATLPVYGALTLDGVAVTEGQIITFEDIISKKFKYTPDSSRTDIEFDPFEFSVADIGSKEFATWQ